MRLATVALCASAASGFRLGPIKLPEVATAKAAAFPLAALAPLVPAAEKANAISADSPLDLFSSGPFPLMASGFDVCEPAGLFLCFVALYMLVGAAVASPTSSLTAESRPWQSEIRFLFDVRRHRSLLRAATAQQLTASLMTSILHYGSSQPMSAADDSLAFVTYSLVFVLGWAWRRVPRY